MWRTPEQTPETTEQLLEKFSIVALTVLDAHDDLEDEETDVVDKNEYCVIIKVPEENKNGHRFEHIGEILLNEFVRLLAENKLANLVQLNFSSNQLTSLPPEI